MLKILAYRIQYLEPGFYVDNFFGVSSKMWQDYGVADDIEQIKKEYSELFSEDNSKEYFVAIREIHREDQPPQGGWRWHKWGGYIGKHSPQYEYLYDEEDIEKVLCYTVHKVKSEKEDE